MSNGQTCIVIGATGAIGSEVARGLAKQGSNLVLVYQQAAGKAEKLAEELSIYRGRMLTHAADVTKPEEIGKLMERTLERFGGVDVLINTQGWLRELHFLHEETPENMQKTIDVELSSVINLCKAVIPSMIERNYGRIVTVGSDSGKAGSSGGAISAACRAGVIGLSKSLARELARYKVTANVVCPGPTESPLLEEMLNTPGLTGKLMSGMVKAIPLQRLARPEEVATLAVFLASPSAGFITGQAISVSGGLTMS